MRYEYRVLCLYLYHTCTVLLVPCCYRYLYPQLMPQLRDPVIQYFLTGTTCTVLVVYSSSTMLLVYKYGILCLQSAINRANTVLKFDTCKGTVHYSSSSFDVPLLPSSPLLPVSRASYSGCSCCKGSCSVWPSREVATQRVVVV